MANTEDLRYVRTETAIRAAFIDLAAHGPVASVSASAVCKQAGISRNAFYLHYSGVAQLYATLVSELVEDVRAESLASAKRRAATGDDQAFYELLLSSIARHEDMLRVLLPADDGSLSKQLAEGMEQAFLDASLIMSNRGETFENRLRCSYAGWAVVGFVVRWIQGTDESLSCGLDCFRELHACPVESSANYLL